MADIISDGKTKVAWLPTVADTTAPTTAEIGGGVDLHTYITPDGLGIEPGTDEVDVTALSSTYNSTLPGRHTISTEITMKHQGDAVAPFSTFAGKPEGYLVVRRHVDATTAWTADDVVDVFPAQAGTRRRQAPAANEVMKFSVGLYHTSEPTYGAVVV